MSISIRQMRINGLSHGGDMGRRGTTTAAHNTCSGIDHYLRIARHEFGGAVVGNFSVNPFGNAAVALGD